jgi:hypothetical protein
MIAFDETKTRRSVPSFRIRCAECEVKPCIFSQHTQPEPLSASIAVNERMGGIHFIYIDSRPQRELSLIPANKVTLLSKLSELLPHPRGNVSRNRKRD